MKPYLLLLLCCWTTAGLFAQRRAAPTAEQAERVLRTTTEVVLTGHNMLLEAALRSAVEKKWNLTPVAFIDTATFHRHIGDANRTFLLIVGGTFNNDAAQNGYTFLNFLMGGHTEFDKLSDFLLWPLACKGQDEDNAWLFMEAFIDIIQQHIRLVQQNPSLVRADMDTYNNNIPQLRTRTILIADDDIPSEIPEAEMSRFNGRLKIVSRHEVADAMMNALPNTVAGIALFPLDEQLKSPWCYTMLITCDTHELIYFKRHKVRNPKQRGFLKEELRRISIPFRVGK
ncbi:MAG: hypothetical protein LBD91_01825 [Prevotellaceae bacterium]|nr:hypothetical protein [Prevotellaceae bacterium]